MNREVQILRETIVAVTKILGDKQIPVTQVGSQAYVEHDDQGNPVRVNIPSVPDDASPDLIAAIQGFIDHEVGHLLFSDFKVLSRGCKEKVGSFHNLIEDTYVERAMSQRFRGSRYNLDRMGKFFMSRITQKEYEEAVASGDKRQIVGSLMVALIRAESGQQLFADFMADKMEGVKDFMDCWPSTFSDRLKSASNTLDTLKLAHELKDALEKYLKPPKEEQPPPPPPPSQPSDEEQSGDPDDEQDSDQDGSDGDGEENDEDDGKEGSGDSDSDEEGDGDEQSEGDKDDADEGEDDADTSGSGDEEDEDGEEEQENGLNPEGDGGDADQEEDKDGDSESGSSDEPEDDDNTGQEDEADGEGDSSDQSIGQESHGEVDWEKDPEGDEKGSGSMEDHGMAAQDADDDDEDELTDEEKAEIQAALEEMAEQMGDFDEKMAELISDYARDCNDDSNYTVFTREDDILKVFDYREEGRGGYRTYSSADAVKKMEERVDHMLGTIAKDIERTVFAKTLCRKLPGQRRGQLNPSSLHKLSIGKHRPDLRDDRVFSKKEVHTGKDIAVSLVVDGSGSMNGTPIQTASDTAYALASVLDRLGISTEVMCFTTASLSQANKQALYKEVADSVAAGKKAPEWTRLEALNIQIFKEFGERMIPQIKERFAMYPHAGRMRCNIDGECVEIAARRLMARPEHGKLMMVLSDGQPSGCETHYRQIPAHLKNVVKKVMKAGVNVVGIGIETNVVQNYYPKNVVLHAIKDLPALVMRELKQAILSASH